MWQGDLYNYLDLTHALDDQSKTVCLPHELGLLTQICGCIYILFGRSYGVEERWQLSYDGHFDRFGLFIPKSIYTGSGAYEKSVQECIALYFRSFTVHLRVLKVLYN